MTCSKIRHRIPAGAAALAAVLWLTAAAPALATPDEDYQAGKTAYASGDMVTAMAKLRPAAETGHVKSQVLLGVILDAAEFDEDAAGMFRRAADAGDAEGEFYLGSMYSNGEGVKKDEAEALRLLKSAADKGHQQALRVVAAAYADGMLGIGEAGRQSQDALSWIRRSADQEDSRALRTLAEAYRSGRFGLGTDAKMADELLAKANKIDRINEGKRRKERK